MKWTLGADADTSYIKRDNPRYTIFLRVSGWMNPQPHFKQKHFWFEYFLFPYWNHFRPRDAMFKDYFVDSYGKWE